MVLAFLHRHRPRPSEMHGPYPPLSALHWTVAAMADSVGTQPGSWPYFVCSATVSRLSIVEVSSCTDTVGGTRWHR